MSALTTSVITTLQCTVIFRFFVCFDSSVERSVFAYLWTSFWQSELCLLYFHDSSGLLKWTHNLFLVLVHIGIGCMCVLSDAPNIVKMAKHCIVLCSYHCSLFTTWLSHCARVGGHLMAWLKLPLTEVPGTDNWDKVQVIKGFYTKTSHWKLLVWIWVVMMPLPLCDLWMLLYFGLWNYLQWQMFICVHEYVKLSFCR